jgi:hypothetical protein
LRGSRRGSPDALTALIAFRETVPDMDMLIAYIVNEFEELKRAVEQRGAKADAPREKSRTKGEQKVAGDVSVCAKISAARVLCASSRRA